MHPDHGGDEAAFIRLCAAYRRIVEDLEPPAGPVSAGSATDSRAGLRDPDLDRRAYVAWVRGHARSTVGRHRRRAWWRKHPKLARAILFGLIVIFGVSLLGFTVFIGPNLIDRVDRRAREQSRARPAPPSRARPVGGQTKVL